MILKLQIALTILACLFVTAVFPVAAWCSLGWGVVAALCALLCFGGVLLCKQRTQTNDTVDEEAKECERLVTQDKAGEEENQNEENKNLQEK